MILCIPSKGLQPSTEKHNCRIDVLADWIEGSTLLTQTHISKTDVVDMLIEGLVYRDDDFAGDLFLTYGVI